MKELADIAQPVLQGGAIALCLYVLFWAWRTVSTREINEVKLRLIRTIMFFSIWRIWGRNMGRNMGTLFTTYTKHGIRRKIL